jgi:hypothetical protein
LKHCFAKRRGAYIHVSQTGGSVILNESHTLNEEDGAFISGVDELMIQRKSTSSTELLLFDLE